MARAPEDVVALLLRERPCFHFGGSTDLGLHEDCLRWLARVPEAAGRTLETGAGMSTVVLLSRASHHTSVTPAGEEHDAIRAWCSEHDIDTSAFEPVVAPSQIALPQRVDDGPLDLVLIDGWHGFPVPQLDWFYTADRLREGGLLMIDDQHLRPCRLLRDFLARDTERWRDEGWVGRAAVFRKLVDEPVSTINFPRQPWSSTPLSVPTDPLRHRVSVLRSRLKVRTRLRAAVRRLRTRPRT